MAIPSHGESHLARTLLVIELILFYSALVGCYDGIPPFKNSSKHTADLSLDRARTRAQLRWSDWYALATGYV
jgi:hypothetical protein